MAANLDFHRLVERWFDAAKVQKLPAELRGQIERLRDEFERTMAPPHPKYVEFEDDPDLAMDAEQYSDAIAGVASHLLQAKFDVPEAWTVDDRRIAERLDAVAGRTTKKAALKKLDALREHFAEVGRIGDLERGIIQCAVSQRSE